MEYGWKCIFGVRDLMSVSLNCRIRIFGFYFLLLMLLVLVVASYSYAAESLTLEQAVNIALHNNPRTKAADSRVEAADAEVLGSAAGFLPR